MRRYALLCGIGFGSVVAAVDTLMFAIGPSPTTGQSEQVSSAQAGTDCVNFLLSCIFFFVCGYLAAGLTTERDQGRWAGLLAGAIAGSLGALLYPFVSPEPETVTRVLALLLMNTLWNAPLGFVFGSLGGRFGASQV